MKLKPGKPRPAFTQPWTPEEERQAAREAGLKAFGIEPVFHLHYRCIYCHHEWDTDWSCECDDDCAECGATMTPYDYEIDNEIPEEE